MSEHFTISGAIPKMQLKQLSAQWLEENVRGPHALSSEEVPAVPYLPFRFLPALQYFDTINRMREGIVLLKGTIVSTVNPLQTVAVPTDSSTANGNQEVWDSAQQWPLFLDRNGVPVSVTLEQSINGYGSDVHALLLPATGPQYASVATGIDYTYTTNDSSMGRLRVDGSLMEAGDTVTMLWNNPVGVVMDDIYVDYRGQFLNYHTEGRLLTNVYKQMAVVYPYVDITKLTDVANGYFGTNVVWTDPGVGETAIKPTIDKLYRYLHGPTASLVNGAKIVSDEAGNPTIYAPVYTSGSETVLEAMRDIADVNKQVIGSLEGLNPKQPHSLNDLTDTMLGSMMTGTDTMGIESELFLFTNAILGLANPAATITRTAIKTAIRKGHFGWATLWINVR